MAALDIEHRGSGSSGAFVGVGASAAGATSDTKFHSETRLDERRVYVLNSPAVFEMAPHIGSEISWISDGAYGYECPRSWANPLMIPTGMLLSSNIRSELLPVAPGWAIGGDSSTAGRGFRVCQTFPAFAKPASKVTPWRDARPSSEAFSPSVSLSDKIVGELRALHDGWNGTDSLAPSVTLVDDVKAFFDRVEMAAGCDPDVQVDEDGTVAFFWRQEPTRLFSVNFGGKGLLVVSFVDSSNRERYAQRVIVRDNPALFRALTKAKLGWAVARRA